MGFFLSYQAGFAFALASEVVVVPEQTDTTLNEIFVDQKTSTYENDSGDFVKSDQKKLRIPETKITRTTERLTYSESEGYRQPDDKQDAFDWRLSKARFKFCSIRRL